ncbi:MAG: glycosyltransferase family 4 protein [bacterium]
MKVAMVGPYPLDSEVVPGGVAAVTQYLTRGLGRIDEIDLHVICCDSQVPQDGEEERDGATIHFRTCPRRLAQSTNWLFQRWLITKVLRYLKPDIVHGQGLELPALVALHSGLPHVVTLHGVIWKETELDHPSWYRRLRGRFHARQALRQMLQLENVFIISEYAARMLPAAGNYRQFVVNNPIGNEMFTILNQPRSPHIIMVGGLRHRKDPLTGIRVMERVLETVPDATLHILGLMSGTPLDDEVASYIMDRQLGERVKVLGLVPDKVLQEEYARASLLLITSIEETAPIAIGEACAAGVPCVGTDAGGIPFMIHEGVNGFVRPIKDVTGLAERVVAILQDEELRGRLARGAKEIGQREFALDSIAAKTVAAYRDIIAATASS